MRTRFQARLAGGPFIYNPNPMGEHSQGHGLGQGLGQIQKIPTGPLQNQRGLLNIGNTCYLNSAFQCLRHTAVFREYLGTTKWQKHRHPDRKGYNLAHYVSELVAALAHPGSAPLHPQDFVREFLKAAQDFNSDIRFGVQADADEAIGILLDSLHIQLARPVHMVIQGFDEEQKALLTPDQLEYVKSLESWNTYYNKEYSPFIEGFFGQTQVRLVCNHPGCTRNTVAYEPWNLLKLEIPGADVEGSLAPDLHACLASFFKSELLADYTCELCKQVGTTRKDYSISRFPPTIIITLKRFTNSQFKVRAPIAYDPDDVDLSEWRSWSSIQTVADTQYRIVSTIEHLGTSRGGHYKMRHRIPWKEEDDADDDDVETEKKTAEKETTEKEGTSKTEDGAEDGAEEEEEEESDTWLVFDDARVTVSSCGGESGPDTYVLVLEKISP